MTGYEERAGEPIFDAEGEDEAIVRRFHDLYMNNPCRTFQNTYWFGKRVVKSPFDLWIYQEIIHATRPAVVVETGTAFGGSAWYFASLFDLIGGGRVITVDISPLETPAHPRITYITGDSIAPDTVAEVRERIEPEESVMVVLDSKHHRDHVIEELRIYGELVRPGHYMVAEDTNINLNVPQPRAGRPFPRPGPLQAVREFVAEQDRFVVDRTWEKFFVTFHPYGYLRCVK
jgi:cephalosporin hydroxylase